MASNGNGDESKVPVKGYSVSDGVADMFGEAMDGHDPVAWSHLFNTTLDVPISDSVLQAFRSHPSEETRLTLAVTLVDALRRGTGWNTVHEEGGKLTDADLFIWLLEGLPVTDQHKLVKLYAAATHRAFPFYYYAISPDGDLEARINSVNLREALGGRRGKGHLRFLLSLGSKNVQGKSTFLNKFWFPTQDGKLERESPGFPFLVSKESGGSLREISADILPDSSGALGCHVIDVHGSAVSHSVFSTATPGGPVDITSNMQHFVRGMAKFALVIAVHLNASADLSPDGRVLPSLTPLVEVLDSKPEACVVIFRDFDADSGDGSAELVASFERNYPNVHTVIRLDHIWYVPASEFQRQAEPLRLAIKERASAELKEQSADRRRRARPSFYVFHRSINQRVLPFDYIPLVTGIGCELRATDVLPPKAKSNSDTVSEIFSLERKSGKRIKSYEPHKLVEYFVSVITHHNSLALAEFQYQIDAWKGGVLQKLRRHRRDFLTLAEGEQNNNSADAGTEMKVKAEMEEIAEKFGRVDVSMERFWREVLTLSSKLPSHPLLESVDAADVYRKGFLHGNTIPIVNWEGLTFQQETMRAACVGDTNKVLAVSIIGPQSSGKSHLLNCVLGSNQPVGLMRCTLGLTASFIHSQMSDLPDLLVMDTEGVLAIENYENNFDLSAITAAMSLSHIVLLNTYVEIKTKSNKKIDDDEDDDNSNPGSQDDEKEEEDDEEIGRLVIPEDFTTILCQGITQYFIGRPKNGTIASHPRLLVVIRDAPAELDEDRMDELQSQLSSRISEAVRKGGAQTKDVPPIEGMFAMPPAFTYQKYVSPSAARPLQFTMPNPEFGEKCFHLRKELLEHAIEMAFEANTTAEHWYEQADGLWKAISTKYSQRRSRTLSKAMIGATFFDRIQASRKLGLQAAFVNASAGPGQQGHTGNRDSISDMALLIGYDDEDDTEEEDEEEEEEEEVNSSAGEEHPGSEDGRSVNADDGSKAMDGGAAAANGGANEGSAAARACTSPARMCSTAVDSKTCIIV